MELGAINLLQVEMSCFLIIFTPVWVFFKQYVLYVNSGIYIFLHTVPKCLHLQTSGFKYTTGSEANSNEANYTDKLNVLHG